MHTERAPLCSVCAIEKHYSIGNSVHRAVGPLEFYAARERNGGADWP